MKTIKHIIYILTVFIFAVAWGCSDYLDVNHNPDTLEDIPEAKVLLPSAEVGIANNLMGWDYGFAGAFWVEYWTQTYTASQFKTLCEYQEQNFNTAYQSLMSQPLADLERIKTLTAGDENKGYWFIAEALSIFTWQIIADVWGGIPYFEALKGDEGIDHPKFDTGETIYADLMNRVDELLKVDLSKADVDATYDFIYEGHMDLWVEFVNSLKLKLMLRVSETAGYNNATVLTFIESGADFLSESAKIPGTVWNDAQEGKRHPMREFQQGGANYLTTNVIGCKTFVDYLGINGDPRLGKLFTAGATGQLGAFFGDFDSPDDSDGNGTLDADESYSRALFTGNMDLMLMSLWEVNFYIAEVYARAGNMGEAQSYYEDGVMASLAQHAISSNAIIGAGGYAQWAGGTTEQCIKQIAMQKWVANANYQHIESFLERNRTKYPSVNEIDIRANRVYAWYNFPVGDLTISVNGRERLGGNLPASPLYPESYISRNINAPSQKTDLSVKVWWDKKAGK